jgi:hypothetical protein
MSETLISVSSEYLSLMNKHRLAALGAQRAPRSRVSIVADSDRKQKTDTLVTNKNLCWYSLDIIEIIKFGEFVSIRYP